MLKILIFFTLIACAFAASLRVVVREANENDKEGIKIFQDPTNPRFGISLIKRAAKSYEELDDDQYETTLRTQVFNKHLKHYHVTTDASTSAESEEEDSMEATTRQRIEKVFDIALKVAEKVAEKSRIPSWVVVSLIILAIIGIVGIAVVCVRKRRN